MCRWRIAVAYGAPPGLVASDEPYLAAEGHLNSPFEIFNYTAGRRRPIR